MKRQIKQKAPFASVEEEVFLSLRRVTHQLLQPWAEYLRRNSDLTHAQYNVLRILRGAGPEGLTTGGIAERMVEHGCDATRLVDRLVSRGLVRREGHTGDRRVVRVVIEEAGLESLRQLDGAVGEVPKRALASLTREQLASLRELLAVLLEAGESGRTACSEAGGTGDGEL